jgi:HK97 family phage major capsid protein
MPSPGLTSTWGLQDWADYVLEHLSAESVLLRSGARRVNVIGRVAHLPRVLSDGAVAWVEELAEIPSSAPNADELVLTPKKLANVVTVSNEAAGDSTVGVLDNVGAAMTRAVALALDATALASTAATAARPAGIRSLALPAQTGGVTIDNIIRAIGAIAASGGIANAVYIAPADLTTLRLAKDTDGRPLLQPDLQAGGAERIAGATLHPTAALTAGTAVVADAAQVVVGVRADATVDFSTDAKFTSDAVVARVVARVDFGVNDIAGLVVVTTP